MELRVSQVAIPTSKIVTKIFSRQKPEGYWEEPMSPYLPKYKSSYWQIMILGQLGMNKTDERVRKVCEYIFQFQLPEGVLLLKPKPLPAENTIGYLRRRKNCRHFMAVFTEQSRRSKL